MADFLFFRSYVLAIMRANKHMTVLEATWLARALADCPEIPF
jgi:hypothetical protein